MAVLNELTKILVFLSYLSVIVPLVGHEERQVPTTRPQQ